MESPGIRHFCKFAGRFKKKYDRNFPIGHPTSDPINKTFYYSVHGIGTEVFSVHANLSSHHDDYVMLPGWLHKKLWSKSEIILPCMLLIKFPVCGKLFTKKFLVAWTNHWCNKLADLGAVAARILVPPCGPICFSISLTFSEMLVNIGFW